MMQKMKPLLMAGAVLAIATVAYTVPVAADCGGTKTQLVSCDGAGGLAAINSLITIAVSVLSVLIGIVAVGGIAYAAILYASASDDQKKVSEARTIIRNIIIGLLLYGFTIAIINWLIPGGVISSGSSTGPSTSPSPSVSTSTTPTPTTTP